MNSRDLKCVVYDCLDHPNGKYRSVTLRIYESATNVLALQGVVLSENWQGLVKRIADGLGAELRVVGPPAGAQSHAATSPVDRTVDSACVYEVARGQLSLF